MKDELRHIELNDWITITLLSCVVIIVIARWFSAFNITDLLSSYFKDRFIKLSRNGEDGSSVLIVSSVVVYSINISLFLYLFYQISFNKLIELNGYIMVLTATSVFVLAKHFIGKLIATLCNFEEMLFTIDHHRNIYRAMFAFGLLIINLIVIYAFEMHENVFLTSFITICLVLFAYNLILIYRYRNMLISSNFYFILYLCTLEIAPYLLLYKYIML
ncbi:MAG: DUF4271 domain-containing protein [Nonlabens sp.]|uniref:DUF4271 domain-containing protein n=1 Tax=Nonlabens sp. TaxID=1888209 RepID=UPI00321A035D